MFDRIIICFALTFSFSSTVFAQGGWLDRTKETATKFETPDISDFTSAGTEKAVRFASDSMVKISSEFSRMKPKLELLGYRIANAQFQMLPPSGKLCVVSTTEEAGQEIGETDGDGLFIKSIIYAAISAKKVQSIIDMPVVVLNIEIGGSPNIKFFYYSKNEVDILSREEGKFYDEICTYSQLRSMRQ